MIELMVVITVIGILASLLTVAGFAFVERAKEAATRTTITKVDEAIMERVTAINRYHERPVSRLTNDWNHRDWYSRFDYAVRRGWPEAVWTAIEYSDNFDQDSARSRQKTLSRKDMLRESLPMTRSELEKCYWVRARFDTNGDGRLAPPGGPEQTALATFLNDIDPDRPGAQSVNRPGEVFLYALLNAPVFGGLPMTEDDFTEEELIDPDEIDLANPTAPEKPDGVPELGDAWGNSLYFYRWPTELVNGGQLVTSSWKDNIPRQVLMTNAPEAATAAGKDPLKQDPDDPAGTLLLNNVDLTVLYHDRYTWHAPLIVSPGPDGQLGLDEPDVSLPLVAGGTTVQRFGLARAFVTPFGTPTTPTPVKPSDPLYVPIAPTTPEEKLKFEEYLFDNLTNHNSDGGL